MRSNACGEGLATQPDAPVDVGIGLRHPHYRDFSGRRPALDFVEVHSENFFADGGAALAVLRGVRDTHAVSLHGVGLGLGSAVGLDDWHLERLALLVEWVEPVRVSDHACFARAPLERDGHAEVVHAADLLPIAFTTASLDILCANVDRVQQRLRRTILVENLSAYLSFDDDDQMPEAEFLTLLTRRTGCALLLDVNNLVVNALNAQREAFARGHDAADPVAAACGVVDALPADAIGEIHLAGYCDAGGIVVDDHGSRVHEPVWAVYRHALARLGARPTLVEWDTALPALDVLLDEAASAAALQRGAGSARRAA